jgi:hypothetical protein
MARYTKRHYIEQARIIRKGKLVGAALEQQIQTWGKHYEADNPLFSWERWFAACKDGMIRERAGTREKPL